VARPRLTGVLLVGGASTRFGSPKALARLNGETLAARAWRTLGEACDERLAVGKAADRLELPFEILDDGTDVRHPAAGLVAGLRAAPSEVTVFLPVDIPLVRAEDLRALGECCAVAAVPAAGKPLPGAFRKSALPALERCLERRASVRSALGELDVRTVRLDPFRLGDADTPEELRRLEGRRRALNAAVSVARTQRLDAFEARVIQDWNDTVVHLAPAPVVARVRTSWAAAAEDGGQTYAREIAVATHAAARGGPVVPPASTPGPFRSDGLVVALWQYAEQLPEELTDQDVAHALRALHSALDGFEGELPQLEGRLDRAAAVISDPEAVPRLDPQDRVFLEATFRGLRSEAAARSRDVLALHGGAHRGNLLVTPEGPRWIDLDTVCRGPLEWDLAHIGEAAATGFAGHDPELLEVMRGLVGAEVAIWCWHTYGRAPEVDQAAGLHLERLREGRT
jgi:molybdopterin-guanine dinucleotide biosynthesis protein A